MKEHEYHILGTGQYQYVMLFAAIKDKAHNNINIRINFISPIDEETFLRAIKYTFENLPYCRLRLHEFEDGDLKQYLSDEEPGNIEVYDFSDKTEPEINDIVRTWCKTAFPNDCNDVQLVSARVMRLPEGRHGVLFLAHHVIMDAYGMMHMVRYVDKTYAAMTEGKELPAPGELPWDEIDRDWAFEQTARYQADLAWWEKEFETEPHFTSVNGVGSKEFIEGKNYGRAQTPAQLPGDILFRRFPAAFVDRVNNAALKANVSPQVFYMLAIRTFLARVSQTDDVLFDTLVARRSTRTQRQIGISRANTIPFRTILSEELSFNDALIQVSEKQREVFRHAAVYPIETATILNEKHEVPLGGTYRVTWLTYQPYFDLETANLDFEVHAVSIGTVWPALYIIIQPKDNSGDLWGNYAYSIDYTDVKSIERLHSFILDFLSEGMENGELSVKELTDRNLK